MFTVKFVQMYNSIPVGFEFQFDGNSVKLNGVTLTLNALMELADMGIVNLINQSVPAPTPRSTSSVVCHIVGTERDKVVEAVGEDINNYKFVFGQEYKFYDIENMEWKVSRLKKTASHLGRIAGGFAVPVDATNRKMFNRLEKLNTMYNLGLDRDTIRDITDYN